MNERVWGIGGMTLAAEIRSTWRKSWFSPTNIIHDKTHMDWPVVIVKEICGQSVRSNEESSERMLTGFMKIFH